MDALIQTQLKNELKFCAVEITTKSGVKSVYTQCRKYVTKLGYIYPDDKLTEEMMFDLINKKFEKFEPDEIATSMVVYWEGMFYLDGGDDAM